jgi:hypothetical protein
LKKYTDKEFTGHCFHNSALEMLGIFRKNTAVNDGFSDTSLVETYKEEIDILPEPLFPKPL